MIVTGVSATSVNSPICVGTRKEVRTVPSVTSRSRSAADGPIAQYVV